MHSSEAREDGETYERLDHVRIAGICVVRNPDKLDRIPSRA
jgi:hypothetical protein